MRLLLELIDGLDRGGELAHQIVRDRKPVALSERRLAWHRSSSGVVGPGHSTASRAVSLFAGMDDGLIVLSGSANPEDSTGGGTHSQEPHASHNLLGLTMLCSVAASRFCSMGG
jgi:hypothetical protein